jgi:hypothetical protein
MKQKKVQIETMLDKEYTNIVKKNRWTAPALILLIVAGFVLLVYGILRCIGFVSNNYTLLFPKIIEVKLQPPVIFVKKVNIDTTLMIDEEIDRQLKDKILPTPTVTPTTKPKTRSSIIKEVEATNYTYMKYSNRPYYGAVLAGLKSRYVNWEDAAELQAKEGMFQPEVLNPTSGACGLPQALPCSKMNCPLDESGIDCQLDWQKEYIIARYGTIDKALAFRIYKGWY